MMNHETFTLVDHTRENWNCIFEGLEELDSKLAQLGIDDVMEADNV